VVIGPEKYNELYDKIGNLNKLLAWGHARSIENILETVACDKVIADQFGDESFIQKALLDKGKEVDLLQMPKAEKHIAVASASILAREAFLQRLEELGRRYDIKFPKGATAAVEDAGNLFVKKFGKDQLLKCAKLHFRTTDKLGN
jgi:ribonuclease HIII